MKYCRWCGKPVKSEYSIVTPWVFSSGRSPIDVERTIEICDYTCDESHMITAQPSLDGFKLLYNSICNHSYASEEILVTDLVQLLLNSPTVIREKYEPPFVIVTFDRSFLIKFTIGGKLCTQLINVLPYHDLL